MSPLKLRKELLIAESELNRAQLINEWQAATEWHRTFSAGVRTISSVASAAALLVSGIRVFRRKHSSRNGAKPSWLQPIVKGAGVISSLWGVFRPGGCGQKNK